MAQPTTLLVFAHQDEASAFADVPHLVTGVGKVNGAVSLSKALLDGVVAGQAVERVVVLGTAGVVGDGDQRLSLEDVFQITTSLQHDFSLTSPALAPAGEVVLEPQFQTTIATGDVFVQNDEQRTHISGLGAALVDMETYAYATVCEKFGVPLQVFKIPSDYADSSTTAEEWDQIVFRKSVQLREFWDGALQGA